MAGTLESRAATAITDQHQYLTFTLDHEEYGIEILRVQEIKGAAAITPIPNAPTWLKGVMNLRGTVVPVVDLRAKFGLPPSDGLRFSVVIVVNVGTHVVGLVVDAVSDVLDFDPADTAPTPDLGGEVDTSFLTGIAKSSDRLIALLAIDRVVGIHELEHVAA